MFWGINVIGGVLQYIFKEKHIIIGLNFKIYIYKFIFLLGIILIVYILYIYIYIYIHLIYNYYEL